MKRRTFIKATLGFIAGAVAAKALPETERLPQSAGKRVYYANQFMVGEKDSRHDVVLISHRTQLFNYQQLGYSLKPNGWQLRGE